MLSGRRQATSGGVGVKGKLVFPNTLSRFDATSALWRRVFALTHKIPSTEPCRVPGDNWTPVHGRCSAVETRATFSKCYQTDRENSYCRSIPLKIVRKNAHRDYEAAPTARRLAALFERASRGVSTACAVGGPGPRTT